MLNGELTLTQRILVRAAELIRKPNGWCKYRWYAKTAQGEQVCMLGAIGKATTELTGIQHINMSAPAPQAQAYQAHIDRVVNLVAPHLPKARLGGRNALSSFNDDPATTQEQVHTVFCQAVKQELGASDEETEGEAHD